LVLWAGIDIWARGTPARALENGEKKLGVGREAPKWGALH